MSFKFGFHVVAAITVFFCANARAGLSPLSFGAKVGYGLASNLETSSGGLDLTTHRYNSGYLFGGSVDVGLGPVGVSADLLWAKRTLTVVPATDVSMNRVEVPVLVHLSTGLLQVQGGLYYALSMGDVSVGGTSQSYSAASLSSSDMGLVGGLGFSIPLGLVSGLFELRYSYGLKNLRSAPVGEEALKFQALDLIAGVYF
jgi:hypothetical protein